MTEEQMQEFFKWHEDRPLATINGFECAPMENLYQAFKARLKSEATCNCWPKEAVRG